MINLYIVNKYCKDDIEQIENYNLAINDYSQTWHCHHRLETELNLTCQQLKDQNLYYNRPASELIFLTCSEHLFLHKKGHKGCKLSDETRRKMSEYHKLLPREKHPHYGKHIKEETKKKLSEARKGKHWKLDPETNKRIFY